MHTTNIYPTPYNLVRLGALDEMKKKFPNVVLGLSDHTISNLASIQLLPKELVLLETFYRFKKEKGQI